MTPLQLFILRTIHRHGPQSEAALWNHSKGETLPAVVRAIATLAEAEFIEHTPINQNPQRFPLANESVRYWRLTQKGSQRAAENAAATAACNAKQEVTLGS